MNDELTKINKRIASLEKWIADLENVIKGGKENAVKYSHPSKKLSLREFLISKKPTDDVKKTLTIGYYLEKFEGFKSFNIGDLESAFERAKETKPINSNDKVNMNIRKGHMEEALEKKDKLKAWYLTNSGELFVENNFQAST